MTSFEEKIRSVLANTVPLPAGAGRDWEDVLSRSAVSTRTVHMRRLVYSVVLAALVAIVLAATPLGAVIARGFGDFSGWLSGSAGHPVSTSERQTFAHESRRSWVRFPQSAKLRRLIEVTRDGVDYVLYGYQAGNTFCLRLTASQKASSIHTSCGPTWELKSRSAAALPLEVDALAVGREKNGRKTVFIHRALVTFGVSSDGVTAIRARTRSGDLRAVVSGDSFLIVNPNPADSIRSISASDAAGGVATIPFVRPMSIAASVASPRKPLSPPGPKKVERKVGGVTIGWLSRREPRGESWHLKGNPAGEIVFVRLLSPDPGGIERIRVDIRELQGKRAVCLGLVGAALDAGACTPYKDFSSPKWPLGPLWFMESGAGGTEQYATIIGLASDDVRRMTLFLTSGERIPVSLRDNAFILQAPLSDYPVRLAAYDGNGLVIGDEVFPDPR